MKQKNSSKGITLIALVVTIIVLLILAGVVIAMLTGQNGLLTQAQNAREANKRAEIIEQIKLDISAAQIDNATKEGSKTAAISKAQMKEILSKYGEAVYQDGNTKKAIIGLQPSDKNVKEMIPISEIYSGDIISTSEVKVSKGETTNELGTDEISLTWPELKQAANVISSNTSVTNDTSEVTLDVEGEEVTLKVGQWKTVTYKGEAKKVRIIGFNHDVTDGGKKAGITFDFVTRLGTEAMNTTDTNAGGWAAMPLKKSLNSTYLEGITLEGLDAQKDILNVRKDYIKTYNDANSVQKDNYDKLWCLADSEIYPKNSDSDRYAYAITTESADQGGQYKYYQIATNGTIYTSNNSKLRKYSTFNESTKADSNSCWWWLRSPSYGYSSYFCYIIGIGYGYGNSGASNTGGSVAPGFCL